MPAGSYNLGSLARRTACVSDDTHLCWRHANSYARARYGIVFLTCLSVVVLRRGRTVERDYRHSLLLGGESWGHGFVVLLPAMERLTAFTAEHRQTSTGVGKGEGRATSRSRCQSTLFLGRLCMVSPAYATQCSLTSFPPPVVCNRRSPRPQLVHAPDTTLPSPLNRPPIDPSITRFLWFHSTAALLQCAALNGRYSTVG